MSKEPVKVKEATQCFIILVCLIISPPVCIASIWGDREFWENVMLTILVVLSSDLIWVGITQS